MSAQSARHRAREMVLQALYALECGEVDAKEDFSNVIDETDIPASSLKYAAQLYPLVRDNRDWADSQIERFAKNWRLDRIATVDRNILRLAMVEILKVPDVPTKAVLNEAIELAKTFSTPNSSSFVNGILDSFVKDFESSEKTGTPDEAPLKD